MTRLPKVWEPRAGTSAGEEMPEWTVEWWVHSAQDYVGHVAKVRAHHAWDAWLQVKGAPAFGSCRVRRVGE